MADRNRRAGPVGLTLLVAFAAVSPSLPAEVASGAPVRTRPQIQRADLAPPDGAGPGPAAPGIALGDTNLDVITVTGGCLEDVAGVALACSATDVLLSPIVAAVVHDGCSYPGDTAVFEPLVSFVNTGVARHDLGLFLALDAGDAFSGSCAISIFPEAPSPPFFDFDEAADLCGDIGASISGIPMPAITIPCFDSNGDTLADLSSCLSWKKLVNDALCTAPLGAAPGSPSECSCTLVAVTGLVVPNAIEIRKSLAPADDPGHFDLLLDGQVQAVGVGDLGSTGPLPALPGTRTVEEAAGDGTALGDYTSSIECVDSVGRCTGNSALRCISSDLCSAQSAGTCVLTPTPVASCTGCTNLELTAPSAAFSILCTITNTRILFGRILAEVDTQPAGDPQLFDFIASYDGDGFSLADGQQNDSGELPAATYSLAELVPAGWSLDSATCSDGSDPAAIGLAAGETVTCTFVNAAFAIFSDSFESGDHCSWTGAVGVPPC